MSVAYKYIKMPPKVLMYNWEVLRLRYKIVGYFNRLQGLFSCKLVRVV